MRSCRMAPTDGIAIEENLRRPAKGNLKVKPSGSKRDPAPNAAPLRRHSTIAPQARDTRRETKNGGAEGNRTPDLCSAIAALSHLSYGPGNPPKTSGPCEGAD
jgi:hypothetical protein